MVSVVAGCSSGGLNYNKDIVSFMSIALGPDVSRIHGTDKQHYTSHSGKISPKLSHYDSLVLDPKSVCCVVYYNRKSPLNSTVHIETKVTAHSVQSICYVPKFGRPVRRIVCDTP